MIKMANELPSTAFYNALYVKITSLYNSYGTERDFCTFWTQMDESENVVAFICKFYSAVTVCASKMTDIEELNEFLSVIGYSEIQTNIKIKSGQIEYDSLCLKTHGKSKYNFDISFDIAKECYSILNQYPKEISLGSFDEWYVDISHRIRHKAAFILNEANCTALCLIGQNSALLSGIAVNKSLKGTGIGSNVIKQLSNIINGSLFTICSKENLGFYLRAGFIPHEKIYYYKGQY